MARTKKGLGAVSQVTLDRLAESGVSPVEVMVASMRTLYQRSAYCREQAELAYSDADRGRFLEEAIKCDEQACAIAKDVAPYFHPRLASVELKGDDENPLALELTSVDELRKFLRGGTTSSTKEPPNQ